MATYEMRKHPVHFKVTSYIGAILLITAVASFVGGIYLQQMQQLELSHRFAFTCLTAGVLLPAWLVFRMKICRCSSCGKWLPNNSSITDATPRQFSCEKCQITWDTGYVMHFKMTDPD